MSAVKNEAKNVHPPVSKSVNTEKEQVDSTKLLPPKICAVCKDNATGMHFGAMTCEGCKGFFRRSIKKNASFKCSLENKCEISKEKRKSCQACRFKACVDAGMQSASVLSDEEVNKKRDLIKINREKRIEQQRVKKDIQEEQRLKKLKEFGTKKGDIRMTMEEKLLIENLLKGHEESYDFAYQEYETFRGKEKIPLPNVNSNTVTTSLAWLVASMSKNENIQAQYIAMRDTPSCSKECNDVKSTQQPTIPQSTPSAEHLDVFNSLHGTSTTAESSENSVNSRNETGSSNAIICAQSVHVQDEPAVPSSADVPSGTRNSELPPSSNPSIEEDNDSLSYLRDLLRSQGFSMSLVEDSNSKKLLQHFCDIMTWGIRKVIDFCKIIPEFSTLSLADQIVLLRGGCLEMLVLRSYFAFSSDENKYMSDKFQYRPSDFLQAGASEEFVEKYNNLHLRMRKMNLVVEEICLLLALVLFSPDRPGLEDKEDVEKMQDKVAKALYAYEHTHKPLKKARTMYCEMLLILPVLRTINMLFSTNLMNLQETNEGDMNPLILEVNSSTNNDEE